MGSNQQGSGCLCLKMPAGVTYWDGVMHARFILDWAQEATHTERK